MFQSTDENPGRQELSDSMAGAVPANAPQEQLKEVLRANNGDFAWLDGLSLHADGNRLCVKFIHEYFASWFMSHKQVFFEDLLASSFNRKFQVFYEAPDGREWKKASPSLRLSGENLPSLREDGTEEDSFANFITNGSNEFALAAARNASLPFDKEPGHSGIGLLVICGLSGTGKSHLLNAIQAQIMARGAGLSVIKGTARFFCAHYPMLYTQKQAEIFWRRHPFLLLDDVQDLEGEAAWQNMLASYVDLAIPVADPIYAGANMDQGQNSAPHRLVFAFSGRGTDLQNLEKRLRLRMESGLVVELPEPDLEIRMRYVEKANRKLKLALGREQILQLARSSTQIPALTGILRKMEFFRGLNGRAPSMRELENILGAEARTAQPDWRGILAAVARKFGLKPEEIMSASRKPELVLARQITMYLCRRHLGLSYPELGRLLGGKDHSTVIHAIKKIEVLADTDKNMRILLTELEKSTR